MCEISLLSNHPNVRRYRFVRGSASPSMRERRVNEVYNAYVQGKLQADWGKLVSRSRPRGTAFILSVQIRRASRSPYRLA
jgi:hypothetical protein